MSSDPSPATRQSTEAPLHLTLTIAISALPLLATALGATQGRLALLGWWAVGLMVAAGAGLAVRLLGLTSALSAALYAYAAGTAAALLALPVTTTTAASTREAALALALPCSLLLGCLLTLVLHRTRLATAGKNVGQQWVVPGAAVVLACLAMLIAGGGLHTAQREADYRATLVTRVEAVGVDLVLPEIEEWTATQVTTADLGATAYTTDQWFSRAVVIRYTRDAQASDSELVLEFHSSIPQSGICALLQFSASSECTSGPDGSTVATSNSNTNLGVERDNQAIVARGLGSDELIEKVVAAISDAQPVTANELVEHACDVTWVDRSGEERQPTCAAYGY